ncbi:hypothetical protein, partial [Streptomyces capitiformicae]|uniref:hypothetical protein n=1 Tax=Streptomyces capitiformicae TaxID=2014920 RepID=UPI001E546B10
MNSANGAEFIGLTAAGGTPIARLGSAESFEDAIVEGLGHLTRVFGTVPLTPEVGRERLAALQEQWTALGNATQSWSRGQPASGV